MMNHIHIWIYNDEGASQLSVQSLLTTIKTKLSAHRIASVRTISSNDILTGVLSDEYARGILVMPGGADLPYCQKLNGLGNEKIHEFVRRGNIYIGICAGGYYGARDIAFSGEGYEIHGARELGFFSGTAIGSIASLTQGQRYDETARSKAIVTLDYKEGQQELAYYHGGAYFSSGVSVHNSSLNNPKDGDAIASYPDGKAAIIKGTVENGQYLLSGVHFELCPNVYNELVISQVQLWDRDKENALLALISQKHYGTLIYEHIGHMITQVFGTNTSAKSNNFSYQQCRGLMFNTPYNYSNE